MKAGESRTKERTVLIIAPGHGIYDERVLRTVEIASRRGSCYYALERERLTLDASGTVVLPEDVARRLGGNVRVIALPEWKKWRFVSRLTRHLFALQIARQARQLAADVVHVHESGSLGLLIASRVKRLNPGARVIFDYHDWIPYEIAQTCRNRRRLYDLALPVALSAYRRLARGVDLAICISPGHAAWTERKLGISRTLVVQNVRPPPPPVEYHAGEVRPQLVFVGHVMRIRRVEFLIDVLAELRAQSVEATLAICGQVADPAYAAELAAYAEARGVGEKVVFHGAYRDDRDLVPLLSRGSVGVLLGHPQPIDTGILAISSANKFFSYMALGIPALLEEGFENMISILEEHHAGYAFDSVGDCAAKVRRMLETPALWEEMSRNALGVARRMNSTIYAREMGALYAG